MTQESESRGDQEPLDIKRFSLFVHVANLTTSSNDLDFGVMYASVSEVADLKRRSKKKKKFNTMAKSVRSVK